MTENYIGPSELTIQVYIQAKDINKGNKLNLNSKLSRTAKIEISALTNFNLKKQYLFTPKFEIS